MGRQPASRRKGEDALREQSQGQNVSEVPASKGASYGKGMSCASMPAMDEQAKIAKPEDQRKRLRILRMVRLRFANYLEPTHLSCYMSRAQI